jgi:hypothetical protein
MASVTDICNRALQKLGAKRINSLTQDTANARACNAVYEDVLESELRKRSWNFATARAILAANTVPPLFGRKNAFQLPADFLRLLDPDPEFLMNTLDWEIEGQQIVTQNESATLHLKYIAKVTDPNIMDSCFREALAASIAMELCEEITQSNTKKAALKQDYKDAISEAREANAFEKVAQVPPEDFYLTLRN